jgi:hypothetical protein
VDIFRQVDTMSRAMAETTKRRPRRQLMTRLEGKHALRLVLDRGKSIGAAAISIRLNPPSATGSSVRGRTDRGKGKAGVRCRRRLGGLLDFYERAA